MALPTAGPVSLQVGAGVCLAVWAHVFRDPFLSLLWAAAPAGLRGWLCRLLVPVPSVSQSGAGALVPSLWRQLARCPVPSLLTPVLVSWEACCAPGCEEAPARHPRALCFPAHPGRSQVPWGLWLAASVPRPPWLAPDSALRSACAQAPAGRWARRRSGTPRAFSRAGQTPTENPHVCLRGPGLCADLLRAQEPTRLPPRALALPLPRAARCTLQVFGYPGQELQAQPL